MVIVTSQNDKILKEGGVSKKPWKFVKRFLGMLQGVLKRILF